MESIQAKRAIEIRSLKRNDGKVYAEDVVDFARDPKTSLHSAFTWDDAKAAHAHRLNQAREIIRVCVTFEPQTERTVRAYVSLERDQKTGGGYRSIQDVLKSDDLRNALLEDALKSFNLWRLKYEHVTELSEIFAAADRLPPLHHHHDYQHGQQRHHNSERRAPATK